jgi:hypothetical protein
MRKICQTWDSLQTDFSSTPDIWDSWQDSEHLFQILSEVLYREHQFPQKLRNSMSEVRSSNLHFHLVLFQA